MKLIYSPIHSVFAVADCLLTLCTRHQDMMVSKTVTAPPLPGFRSFRMTQMPQLHPWRWFSCLRRGPWHPCFLKAPRWFCWRDRQWQTGVIQSLDDPGLLDSKPLLPSLSTQPLASLQPGPGLSGPKQLAGLIVLLTSSHRPCCVHLLFPQPLSPPAVLQQDLWAERDIS